MKQSQRTAKQAHSSNSDHDHASQSRTSPIALDLFAGAGGWSVACKRLGIEEFGVELMPEAKATRHAAGFSTIYDDVWEGLRDAAIVPPHRLLIASPPCFVAGTPVLTRRGTLPIEQLEIGDEVLTHRHRWRKVTATMTRETDTIRIGEVVTTPDHPFYTRPRIDYWDNDARSYRWDIGAEAECDEGRWVAAGQSQGAYVALPLGAPWEGAEHWADRDARLVGRYLADGWTSRDGVCIAVGSTSVEPAGEWVVSSTGQNCRRFTRGDHELADFLLEHFGKGASVKSIPAWVLSAPHAWKMELLLGYLDGDGTCTDSGWTANTVSPSLASGLRLLAIGLGFTVSISFVETPVTTVIEGRIVNQRDYYQVRINRPNKAKRYCRELDGFLWKKQRFAPVPSGRQQVYDITVEEDHSFNAWGYTVHNCQSFSTAGQGSGRRALDDVLRLIDEGAHRLPADGLRQAAIDAGMDDRTALVLSPLAYIWRHRPELVALEQVPAVLPVWSAYATVLEEIGYSVAAGNLHAEQYGVPQTRKRAILVASRVSEAALPAPTHSKYHPRSPEKLDEGVLPWVSMAEALGWGLTQRPAVAVGNAVGRGLIGGQGAKDGILRAMDSGAFIDSPHGDGSSYAERTRITESEAGMLQSYPPYSLRSNYGTNGNSAQRGLCDVDQPASTITSKADRMLWRRSEPQPEPRRALPAPTIAGDPRIAPRGRKHVAAGCCRANRTGEITGRQFPKGAVRLTQEEAQTLQAFPSSFPFQGTKSKRYLQIGNACPPLLAEAILRELMEAEA